MIEGQAEINHRFNGDGVIHHNRALLDRTGAKDTTLGLINDRRGEQGAAGAVVGDCKSAAAHFFWGKLLAAGALRQVVDNPGGAQQV